MAQMQDSLLERGISTGLNLIPGQVKALAEKLGWKIPDIEAEAKDLKLNGDQAVVPWDPSVSPASSLKDMNSALIEAGFPRDFEYRMGQPGEDHLDSVIIPLALNKLRGDSLPVANRGALKECLFYGVRDSELAKVSDLMLNERTPSKEDMQLSLLWLARELMVVNALKSNPPRFPLESMSEVLKVIETGFISLNMNVSKRLRSPEPQHSWYKPEGDQMANQLNALRTAWWSEIKKTLIIAPTQFTDAMKKGFLGKGLKALIPG
jgi:hypothetical protein